MDSALHTGLFFFFGEVALWAGPSTAPQAEGALVVEGVVFRLADSLAAVSASSAAAEAVLSVVCAGPRVTALDAGPLVDALGEGVGLLPKEGKLSSSRVGAA